MDGCIVFGVAHLGEGEGRDYKPLHIDSHLISMGRGVSIGLKQSARGVHVEYMKSTRGILDRI